MSSYMIKRINYFVLISTKYKFYSVLLRVFYTSCNEYHSKWRLTTHTVCLTRVIETYETNIEKLFTRLLFEHSEAFTCLETKFARVFEQISRTKHAFEYLSLAISYHRHDKSKE